MGKIIQMIWTSDDNCLFIYGMTKDDELIFRTSRNINYLQREKVKVDKVQQMVYTNLYYFPLIFLQNVPIIEKQ